MALYAAYGTNMDPGHMLQRCPSSPVAGTGWLPGWRLTFGGEDIGWDGALATVVEDPDSSVFVVLYDMAESDEKTLDSWEGSDLGLYTKIRLRVHTLDGDVLAWLYALQAYEGGLPDFQAKYLDMLRAGGSKPHRELLAPFGLDASDPAFWAEPHKWPTRDKMGNYPDCH